MLITVAVDSSGWNKAIKREYEKAVKMMAYKLAQSIHKEPARFKVERENAA